MRKLIIITILLSLFVFLYGQDVRQFSSTRTNGGQEKACTGIILLPGFSFSAASSGQKLSFEIDNAVCTPEIHIPTGISSDQNYIVTMTPMGKTSSLDFNNGNIKVNRTEDKEIEVQVNIQYYDGLGRPVQTVQRGAAPNRQDLISQLDYDAFGREGKAWLPTPVSGNGSYQHTISTQAVSYHKDQRPFNEPVYESSPLNRILEQYGAGEAWKSASKGVKTSYLTNTINGELACNHYKVAGSGTGIRLTQSGVYTSGELYVTKITDEEGNVSYQFKNKLGQVVLTRQANNAYNRTEYIDTYYVYDDFGNLSYVLPPMAVDKLSATSDDNEVMKQYAYLYKYDYRNRCIKKRLPGCDWIYYVYDKADQLILSQDGKQRKENKWSFNAYDKLGRLAFSGIHKDHYGPDYNGTGKGRTHEYLIKQFEDLVIQEEKGWLYNYSTKLFDQLGAAPYYYKRCNGIHNEITLVNYYDGYEGARLNRYYFSDGIADFDSKSGFTGKNHSSAKGLLTGTIEFYDEHNGNTNPCQEDYKYTATAFFYDDRGNVIRKKTKNHMGGLDKEYIDYNFAGQPVKRLHEHTVELTTPSQLTGGTPTKEILKTTELYTYDYDHAGRLLKTTHKLDDKAPVILAQNTYDELGRLQSTIANNNTKLKTDYTYNIRSWSNGIKNYHYRQSLDYTYNGNVKSSSWVQDGKAHRYDFRYDGISRLLEGYYTLESENIDYRTYDTWYQYDKNGNPLRIQRMAYNAPYNSSEYVDYMNLAYSGNQVKTVNDGGYEFLGSNGYDFKDYSAGADVEYVFDANGSMIYDPYKGTTVSYGHLNLPKKVEVKNPITNGSIDYTYSFTGQKLKADYKKYRPGLSINPPSGGLGIWSPTQPGTTIGGGGTPLVELGSETGTYYYVGNKIYAEGFKSLLSKSYSSTRLEKIMTENGYIEAGKYYFYVKDHLGNNRIVADQNGTVVQRNDYYPFGTPFAENSNPNAQRFKFGGKELDMMHGLNLFDFHARQYDGPRLQFTTMDPLAEKYYSWSPYNYCANNPMYFIDPTGQGWAEFWKGMGNGMINRVSNTVTSITTAVTSPVQTAKKSVADQQNKSIGRKIFEALDVPLMGGLSAVTNLASAAWSDINGGGGSATGTVIGEGMADAGMAATTAKATQVIGKGLSKVASKFAPSKEYINLASEARTNHIISGDATGGGHAWFGSLKGFKNGITGKKSMFPPMWSKNKIMNAVSDVTVNNNWIQQTGQLGSNVTRRGAPVRFVVEGNYEGINIRVITTHTDIITAFPIP